MFAGHIVYPADVLDQVISLTDTWWPNIGPKETLMIALTTAPDDRTIVCIHPPISIYALTFMQPLVFVLLFYNGSEEEGRANFKPFFELSKLFISILAHLTLEISKKKSLLK